MPALKRSIPEFSPLEAGDIVCSGCGAVVKAEVLMGRRGVETLVYNHKNEEVGCSYRVEKKVYINGEMKGVRPDGTPVKL
jgi:hypothetical protein